ncbi:MAG: insulinase family protein [Rhodospirillaceae bacterium]|nr:insulinase family protein [Rhodospirillaceae bacterium]
MRLRLSLPAAPRPLALLLAVLAALAVVTHPRPAPAGMFNASSFTLDNGLQVVVVENHRAPIVSHMVWYKVGSADAPPGKSGIAHFLEHLMFKGTKTMPPGAFSREVARVGGNENAFTTQDYTCYFQSVAKEQLGMVMRFEADRMANLVLTNEVVLPERDVVIEERRQRTDNDPQAQLMEMLRAVLFLNHPYRLPTIGWLHELQTLTTQDALDFYGRWYAPNNAVVVIAGDVTADEVRPLAERTYGEIPSRLVPERVRLKEPEQFAPRNVTLTSARVQQASWVRLYQAPSYHLDETDAYALDVLAEILGGGTVGRLYRSIAVDQKLATGVGVSYDGDALDLGTFNLYGSPLPGADATAMQQAIDAEIRKLIDGGVTAEEAASAKARLQADAIKARDSLSGPARIIGKALATGSTLEQVEAWADRIGAVTVEQIDAAARKVLVPEHSATGVLLPQSAS